MPSTPSNDVKKVVEELWTTLQELTTKYSAGAVYGALLLALLNLCVKLGIKKKTLVAEIKTLYSGVNRMNRITPLQKQTSKYNPDGSRATLEGNTSQESTDDAKSDIGVQPT